jgi:Zn-dependent protease with chaperone function/type II secretory pathway pseudopilin PulG
MRNTMLQDPDYLKTVHPKEKLYRAISTVVATIFWILIVIGTFWIGLFYTGIFALFIVIWHALFLSYIKGYGIKITEKQFPEIYELAEKTAKKLGMPSVPAIYLYNMDGMFNAFATHFFSRNFIIITTSILDACNDDMKKIEFIIAHEMVHLQRGHTREIFFLLPSRIIPWLGNAYSRACEYTCDGVAGRFILWDKNDACESVLLLPSAWLKRAKNIDLDAYGEQRRESGSFWMTIVQTGSTHPYTFNRIAYLRSLYWEEIQPVRQNIFWILLAPFFGISAWSGWGIVWLMIIIAIIGIFAAALFPSMTAYLQRSRDDARVGHIQMISTSLDAYFADYEKYPETATSGCIPVKDIQSYITTNIIDPTTGRLMDGCDGSNGQTYAYRKYTDSDGKEHYAIGVKMESWGNKNWNSNNWNIDTIEHKTPLRSGSWPYYYVTK